jgi:hypothetical protein
MCVNLIKSIWIAVIIAVVLTLVTSPSTAAACMEMTADNCDSDPYQKEAAVPPCCLTADCPVSHHILANVVDNEVILPNRSIPEENIYPICFATSVTTETSLDPQKSLQREPSQELPSYLYSEYHCRNCLDSEELPQV